MRFLADSSSLRVALSKSALPDTRDGVLCAYPNVKKSRVRWNTVWHITLDQTSRWHENKGSVLVWGPCTKTQPLFWRQREVLFWHDVSPCRPESPRRDCLGFKWRVCFMSCLSLEVKSLYGTYLRNFLVSVLKFCQSTVTRHYNCSRFREYTGSRNFELHSFTIPVDVHKFTICMTLGSNIWVQKAGKEEEDAMCLNCRHRSNTVLRVCLASPIPMLLCAQIDK